MGNKFVNWTEHMLSSRKIRVADDENVRLTYSVLVLGCLNFFFVLSPTYIEDLLLFPDNPIENFLPLRRHW